jgi:hypothetical protein
MKRRANQLVGDVRAIVIAGLDVVDAQGDRLAQHSERRVAILRRAVITKSWVSFYEFAVFSVTALAVAMRCLSTEGRRLDFTRRNSAATTGSLVTTFRGR